MMGSVIGHLPAQPILQRIGAGGSGILHNVVLMGQTQMLNRVLQLMDRLGQDHGQQPERDSAPAFGGLREQQKYEIANQVHASIGNDLSFFMV